MRTALQGKRVFAGARCPRGARNRHAVRVHASKVRNTGAEYALASLASWTQCTGRETVQTAKAPTPLGAYSQGMKADKLLFVGGQLGIVPNVERIILHVVCS